MVRQKGQARSGSADPRSPRARPRRGGLAGRMATAGLPVALFVVFILAWQYGIRAIGVPAYLIPLPSQVWVSLVRGFGSGPLLSDTWATLQEILLGFVFGSLIGLFLGAVVAWSKLLDRLFTPYIIALNGLPKVAIAPLLVTWLGQGLDSKILITALIAFFPLVVNVTSGLAAAEPAQLELLQSLKASRWQVFWKVRAPAALPQVFAGLEIAIVLAPVGAIVGEFVGAQQGLGYEIQTSIELVQPATMFADFLILIVISLVLFWLVRLVERRVVFWRASHAAATSV